LSQQKFPSVSGGDPEGRFWENGNGLNNEKADAFFHHNKQQAQSKGPDFNEVTARTPGIWANNEGDSAPKTHLGNFVSSVAQFPSVAGGDPEGRYWENGNGLNNEKADAFHHHDKQQHHSNGPAFDEVTARTPGIWSNNGPD